jgi:uncharacterized protein (DUF58 family)
MGKIIDAEFISKLERLSISAKNVLAEGGGGIRKSKSKGSSVEFSDYREYASGDDFRKIDWNAYARFNRLFVKLFMEEREANINIFLDISKSMDWGEPNKNIISRKIAAAISYISLSNYDRVSLYTIGNLDENLKFLRSKSSFYKIVNSLEKVEYKKVSNYIKIIKNMNLNMQKGITIIISDLLEEADINEFFSYLKHCKQEVYIFHILAPQEINPTFEENIRIIDSESNDFKDINITDRLIDNYKKVYKDFINNIEKTSLKWGFYYINCDSSEDIEKLIFQIFNN